MYVKSIFFCIQIRVLFPRTRSDGPRVGCMCRLRKGSDHCPAETGLSFPRTVVEETAALESHATSKLLRDPHDLDPAGRHQLLVQR